MSSRRQPSRLPAPARVGLVLSCALGLLLSGLTGVALSVAPAAVQVSFDQYCNLGCGGGDDWTNGIVNATKATYDEGDSVPQRFLITGFAADAGDITFTFTYATSKKSSSNHVAFDYLSSWDASETLGASERPIAGQAFSDEATIPVSTDVSGSPWYSGPTLPDGQRKVQVQNATVTSVSVLDGGGFGTATSEATMTVVLAPAAGTTSIGIVFGGHLSDRAHWIGQATNPASAFGSATSAPTAGDIDGAPFHIRFGSATRGDVLVRGNRDNQVNANAVHPTIRIGVAKRLADGQSATVSPGDQITYEIVATNTGGAAGTVAIGDALSGAGAAMAEISAMSSSDASTCSFSGDSGSCPEVVVPALGSTTVTVVVDVDDLAPNTRCESLTLDNLASSTGDDDGEANNEVAVQIDIPSCASLSLDKVNTAAGEDDEGPLPSLSNDLEFQLVVTNAGGQAAPGVVVEDTAGSGVTITSMKVDGVDCDTAAPWACTVDVPADGSVTIDVAATFTRPAEFCGEYRRTNGASIEDANGAAVTVTSDEVVLTGVIGCPADVDAAKHLVSPADGAMDAGTDDGVVVYKVVVTNDSATDADDVVVSDLAVDNADFTSITLHDTEADAVAGTNALANPITVDVLGNTSRNFWVRAVADLPDPGEVCTTWTLDNIATVAGVGVAVDDLVTVTPVPCTSNVAAEKTLTSDEADEGHTDANSTPARTVTWEIRLTNDGVVGETVTVTDVLTGSAFDQGHATLTSLTTTSGSCDVGTGTCSGVVVPAGTTADAPVVVTVVATVDSIPAGASCEDLTLGNLASVELGERNQDDDGQVNTRNPRAGTVPVLECEPQLQLEKYIRSADGQTWLDADTPGSGPTLTLPGIAEFKVEVTNVGNVGLVDMQLWDHLDPELEQETLLPIGSQSVEQLLGCLVGAVPFEGVLAPGETVTCTFDQFVQEGPHFDVVEVTACWPLPLCFEELQEVPSEGDFELQQFSARRANSLDAFGLAVVVPGFFGTQLTATDPAHYVGAFPPPPPPPSVDSPSIDLVKQGSTTTTGIGSTITYVYTVTNNGNVTVTNVALVDQVDAGSGDVTLVLATVAQGISLAPGASATFQSVHTTADADLGQIVNVATVTGTAGITPVTDQDDWTVTVTGSPGLDVVKTADQDFVTFSDSDPTGSVVTYTYVVTNTGNVTLTAVSLVDDVLGAVTLPVSSLAPGASTTGTATHVVSRADADAGIIVNVAVVTGTDALGGTIDASDSAEVAVGEVLPEAFERPEDDSPAPAPAPAPDDVEVAPETLTATGAHSAALLATSLLLIVLGLGVILLQQGQPVPVVTIGSRRRRRS